MEISINSAQVERWANFSSDYNPIHFDVAAARALGAEGPLVHGMLPVILMLNHAEQRLDAAPSAARSARLRLKRPLEIGRAARLKCQPRPTGRSELSLALKSESRTHILGTFLGRDGPLSAAAASPHCDEWVQFRESNFSLAGSAATNTALAFERVFPSVGTPWLVFSSYAFGEFLRRATGELSAVALTLLAHPRREHLAVVQTGYGVDVADTIAAPDQPFGRIDCFIQPAALVRLEQGCNASCQIRVFRDQEPWLDIHVQLLMKMLTSHEAHAHGAPASALPALH
jgi:hypothetical protein